MLFNSSDPVIHKGDCSMKYIFPVLFLFLTVLISFKAATVENAESAYGFPAAGDLALN